MKTLICPDQYTWALDNIASAVIKNLPEINFTKKKLHRKISSRGAKKYDQVFVMYPRYLDEFDPQSSEFIAGVNSFYELDAFYPDKDHINPEQAEKLKLYKRIAVPCKSLQEYFKKEGFDVHYTPYGVDTTQFQPMKEEKNEVFTVGFAGHPTNQGNKKGYFDYILPAVEKCPNVRLVSALGGENQIAHTDMVHFYNKIDMLICMSRTETGPLPVLEAMACGTPVISSRVGLVPEIVKHEQNGIITNRTVDDLVGWLNKMEQNRDVVKKLGEAARDTMTQWTWQSVIHKWKEFFYFGR